MKYVATSIRLLSLARMYSKSTDLGWWSITRTLFSLYIRSKLSGGSEKIITHHIHGFAVSSYGYPTLIQLYEEIFLKSVYACELPSEKPFIIDCGANIGMATLYFKRQFQHCTVWAFEPNPHAFGLLSRNITVNNLQQVHAFPYLLSGDKGPATFYIPKRKANLNASTNKIPESQTINLQQHTLSSLFPTHKIDLIKIDVEGNEVSIVNDLIRSNTLARVGQLVVEYHTTVGNSSSIEDFKAGIEKENFTSRTVMVQTENSLTRSEIIHFKNNVEI